MEGGIAWKIIFRLLSRGRLVDPISKLPLKITCGTIIKEYREFFDIL
jgi:hypothetical protein